jgi:hypothetical protein
MSKTNPSAVRFSLNSLLLFVTAVALIIGTVLSASVWMEIAIQMVAILAIPVAIFLAIRLRGAAAAFCVGFASIGLWSIIVFHGANKEEYTPAPFVRLKLMFEQNLAKSLEPAIARLYPRPIDAEVRNRVHRSYNKPMLPSDQLKGQFPSEWNTKRKEVLELLSARAARIGSWDLQLAIAILGGAVARIVYGQKPKSNVEG